MTTPRRHLIRLHQPPTDDPDKEERKLQKMRARLEAERNALRRWMVRLKRAFHAAEKIHRRIHRIEQQLARLEDPK